MIHILDNSLIPTRLKGKYKQLDRGDRCYQENFHRFHPTSPIRIINEPPKTTHANSQGLLSGAEHKHDSPLSFHSHTLGKNCPVQPRGIRLLFLLFTQHVSISTDRERNATRRREERQGKGKRGKGPRECKRGHKPETEFMGRDKR